MMGILRRIPPFFMAIILLLFSYGGNVPVRANPEAIPNKLAIIIDSADSQTGTSSNLYLSLQRVLWMNKMPYDTLDVASGAHWSFLESDIPKYSAVLLQASGSRIDSTNSQAILAGVNAGMGAVCLTPDAVNIQLKDIFDISTIGTSLPSANSFEVTQDKFTFGYAGWSVSQAGQYRNHTLGGAAQAIARFPSNSPAIWVASYGSGKTVFHNNTASQYLVYQGILLQSILYAMPMGVASPINSGLIEVDDCPMTYYTDQYLQDYYYNFVGNFRRWMTAYNTRASFFIAFSYSGEISDFWLKPESERAVKDIISSGSELGLHCGSQHLPLTISDWGNQAAIDAEQDKVMAEFNTLRTRLDQDYGLAFNLIKSYVAPMNIIESAGYQSLDLLTEIKYVGTYFDWTAAGVPTGMQAQAVGIEDQALNYLRSAQVIDQAQRNQIKQRKNGTKALTTETQAAAASDYTSPLRDFGWESGRDIYNLPRIQGSFTFFNEPSDWQYPIIWDIYRSMLESGQPYIIFTHPDEADLLTGTFPNLTQEQVFQAYSVWMDFAANHYPFYRWETASQLGQTMSTRSGTLDAQWDRAANTLTLTLPQAGDPIHLKTDRYLNGISQNGNTYVLSFSTTPVQFTSEAYDIVHTGQDYFIYPLNEKGLRPTMPGTPFIWQEVTPGNQAPELSPIGDKQVKVGQELRFTVSASDPNGDTLTFSASNLPQGATFNAGTRTFSWTASSAGTFNNVHFEVSDGSLTDFENITITATANRAPVLDAIGNKEVGIGQLLQFTVSATDPDGDQLTYSATNLPQGATFVAGTRTFSFTPSATGTFPGVHFEVTDDELSDSEDVTITVSENRAPVLDPIGNKQGNTGQLLQFTISGSDPDGDALTYSASNLPQGAAFNAGTRMFSWTPSTAGTYNNVHFEVSDGSLTDFEVITITITQGSQPVEITKTIAAGADDGFSGSWGFYNNLSWYEIGNPGAAYNAWYRFTGITIPAGATIEEAHLELSQSQWTSGTKLIIRAEKSTNPTAPTSLTNHNQRVRTTAGVDWTSGYSDWLFHNTPDFASVIQELVNSFSYSQGASILFLVDNNGSTSGGEATGTSFEGNRAPRLYIRYH